MICTERDDFIEQYQESNPSWEVWLNSEVPVYQDDGRPGLIYSAWERLYNHCLDTNDYIVEMKIRFRSNQHMLPSNMNGYYFAKGARGSFGTSDTTQLFFVGTLSDKLRVQCWKVPEMILQKTEERSLDKVGKCLIKQNINQFTAAQDY